MTPEQEHQIGRCIFREAYDAFLIAHPASLQVLEANPAVQRLTGFRHKQLLGMLLKDLISQEAGELTELIRACQTTSYLAVSEGYQLKAYHGGSVPVHITVSRIHLDPEPLALLIIRDMTERRRAEEALKASQAELRAIFDAEPECVKLLTEDGVLVDMNASGLAMIDADSLDQVKGQCVFPIVAADDRQQFVELIQRACRGEPGRMEFQIVGLKGTRRWMETNVVKFPRAIGAPLALGITRDVTERKRAEEALRRSEGELLHASRLSTVGQMVAALSHEVAQPLSAIGNFAAASERLLATPSTDQWEALKEYNRAIAKENERCRAILQRLRDFSVRTARPPASCDLNAVLRDSVELAGHDLRRHHVTVAWDLAESLPPVGVDRIQLQQVVVNLLTNARDAVSELSGARRRIVVRSRGGEEGVFFEVEDQGVGLAEETRLRIFEPFFTTKESGMGLGLSICQTIVQNHGGQIEALSHEPAGATFRVRLKVLSGAS